MSYFLVESQSNWKKTRRLRRRLIKHIERLKGLRNQTLMIKELRSTVNTDHIHRFEIQTDFYEQRLELSRKFGGSI
jgi:hypothetical protein